MDDVEALKLKLMQYEPNNVEFNDPHFSQQLLLREGNKTMVVQHLLNPIRLVSFREETGKYGDKKFNLYFDINATHTMILPVIFDRHGKKSLYILTYIMRYRRMQ